MKLRFAKLDPSGNTTILVLSPVPRTEQPEIASRLMAGDCLCAEQVGFVEAADLPGSRARLQMMGGEFCGNASMSLAALLAREDGLAAEASAAYPLEVSGAEGLVRCTVTRKGETLFCGLASMPLPESVGEFALPGGARVPLVRFPGIAHLLVPEDQMAPEVARAAISGLCEALDADALGILLMGADRVSMRPLVYVRSTDSAVWERGCGSGTAAVVAHRALTRRRDAAYALDQPGGLISGRAEYADGSLRSLEIAGFVRLVAEGEVYL